VVVAGLDNVGVLADYQRFPFHCDGLKVVKTCQKSIALFGGLEERTYQQFGH